MSDLYTHKFVFELGDSTFINGEVEFNTDGKTSFKMVKWHEPMPLKTLDEFYKLMEMIKNLYENNSGIKKIIIKEKED